MDEIFDIIKKTKINRKYLITTLIGSEILGIIVFIWVLREPLYQKFFQTSPKAYSTTQMEPQVRYKVAQGDYINGSTQPSGKIAVLITTDSQTEEVGKIRADKNGSWYYQIPDNLEAGIKTITTAELDETNNVLSFKNYKVRIIPNEVINFNNYPNTSNENPNLSLEKIQPQINVEDKITESPDVELSTTSPTAEE